MRTRFEVGQKVRIRSDDPSRFAGLEAVVQDIQPNKEGIAILNRYVVAFSWGERQTFYDPQLSDDAGVRHQD